MNPVISQALHGKLFLYIAVFFITKSEYYEVILNIIHISTSSDTEHFRIISGKWMSNNSYRGNT